MHPLFSNILQYTNLERCSCDADCRCKEHVAWLLAISSRNDQAIQSFFVKISSFSYEVSCRASRLNWKRILIWQTPSATILVSGKTIRGDIVWEGWFWVVIGDLGFLFRFLALMTTLQSSTLGGQAQQPTPAWEVKVHCYVYSGRVLGDLVISQKWPLWP